MIYCAVQLFMTLFYGCYFVVTPKFQRIAGESKKQYFDRIDHEAANEVALSLKASRKLREARKRYDHIQTRKSYLVSLS